MKSVLITLFYLLPLLVIIKVIAKKINSTQSEKPTPQPSSIALHGKRCCETSTDGEKELLSLLKNTLSTDEYYIFSDIVIPDCFGATTEIDHVVISNHGIFVIENKDFDAWIFGNPTHKKWTRTYRKGKKVSFQNPLHQNYGHKKALQKALPFVDPSRFYSIIAFSHKSEFKTDIPNDVFFYDEIPDVIKSITDERIDMPRVLLSIGKLSYLCQAPSSDRQEHIKNVGKKHSDQQASHAI